MRNIVFPMLSLLLVACGGSGDGDALESSATACIDSAIEPLISLTSIVDATSRAEIAEATLRDVVVNGYSVSRFYVMATRPRNIVLVGDELRCTTPCAFGSSDGEYVFTLEAPGYRSKTITFRGQYPSVRQAGCTITRSGSVPVNVELDRL